MSSGDYTQWQTSLNKQHHHHQQTNKQTDESNTRPFTYHVVILIPVRFSPTLQVEGQPGFSLDCVRCENAPARCVSQQAWSESPSLRKTKTATMCPSGSAVRNANNNGAAANSEGWAGRWIEIGKWLNETSEGVKVSCLFKKRARTKYRDLTPTLFSTVVLWTFKKTKQKNPHSLQIVTI